MRAILLLLFFLSSAAFCQKTFLVDNFSKDYFGKVYISDTNEVFSKGWVAIFDQKTQKKLIKVDSDELTFSLHDGKVLANILELPYGEQSQIIYEDFNFDGKKDFAIMDGQNSCYHGPSYHIYLATTKGFEYSDAFTELAQDYCGMFRVDHKTKTIATMRKSSCCSHEYSKFKVKNNRPYPIQIIQEDVDPSGEVLNISESNLVGNKMMESDYQLLALEVDHKNLLLSFAFSNKKKMQIFSDEEQLYYIFTDADDKIELLYKGQFIYSAEENSLSFHHNNSKFKITNNEIWVETASKKYRMTGSNQTLYGNLAKLKQLKLTNVQYIN
ncbi:XAC2610-related protein [Acinetobacter sp. MD2(2019)]|uniref:XAC2610-related protein n=1 Tax=Acinetobacter sp. MD2(2019) TaxID=2605273 RepID=UPI002D1F33C2|nr:hypothetical protein [Acinetobacter sp. MD2(2019)]MEB3755005.1 hypothetical protein [Acinetobacter sp. MD2(2019)]